MAAAFATSPTTMIEGLPKPSLATVCASVPSVQKAVSAKSVRLHLCSTQKAAGGWKMDRSAGATAGSSVAGAC